MQRSPAVDRSYLRRAVMDDTINPYEYRDADCSGRSLAALVVAWIGAAMVASVLLKWTYMWIALAVLTLLFLVACGYAACDARRAQERLFAREEARQLERRRRRERELETIAAGVDNYPEILDPPDYRTYWIADLPPAYSTVVEDRSSQVPYPPPVIGEGSSPSRVRRTSNPPPYAIAIQSEPSNLPSTPASIEPHSPTGMTCQNGSQMQSQGRLGHIETISRRPPTALPVVSNERLEDKSENQDGPRSTQVQQAHTSSMLTTGTNYLSNIISVTFGRAQRRANPEFGANEGRPGDSPNINNSTLTSETTTRLVESIEGRK